MQASVQSVTKNQINFDMDANKNCELLSQQLSYLGKENENTVSKSDERVVTTAFFIIN